MLNANKIESDINNKNLNTGDLSRILELKYTTAVNRRKSNNYTPDEVEKLADYFSRTIAYYFDREEKQAQVYKLPEEKLQVVEDAGNCRMCDEKEKRIVLLEKHIELLEFNLGKSRRNGSE